MSLEENVVTLEIALEVVAQLTETNSTEIYEISSNVQIG